VIPFRQSRNRESSAEFSVVKITDFNEVLYKVLYPDTVDFYQPYCKSNSIDDKHRLYFHYIFYNKSIEKSNIIYFYLFNKLDESFDELSYQNIHPETKDFYQPECLENNINDKYRLYFHFKNYSR
jgi:hypothetical protein